MPNPLQRLVNGFEEFRKEQFEKSEVLPNLFKEGQHPKVLVIACSDSRVDPAILTHCDPGDLFVVRNVAALVPPYVRVRGRHHGTSSAIEYAVRALKVEHIVVIGHEACGGMAALATGSAEKDGLEFVSEWVALAEEARRNILEGPAAPYLKAPLSALEQGGVILSLRNLLTFPWVYDAVEAGTLDLHGWYFRMSTGDLLAYDGRNVCFDELRGETAASDQHHSDLCIAGIGRSAAAFDLREFARNLAEGCGCRRTGGGP
jgi:carbonic anhydrase